MKNKAFKMYLNKITEGEAAQHLYQCLRSGSHDENMAYDLFDEVHGENWSINSKEKFLSLVIEALSFIREEIKGEPK